MSTEPEPLLVKEIAEIAARNAADRATPFMPAERIRAVFHTEVPNLLTTLDWRVKQLEGALARIADLEETEEQNRATLSERDKTIAELRAEVADLEHCRLCGKHGVEVTNGECGFAASPKCLFTDRARSALTEGEKS
jgi:hypothetical protein